MVRNAFRPAWLLALWCCLALAAQAQTSDDAVDRYTAEGQQAMAAGHYGEARTDFEQLAKLEPEVAEVHATLGVIYFTLHEYELAVSEVRTAQKLKPTLPKLDSLLGLSLGERIQANGGPRSEAHVRAATSARLHGPGPRLRCHGDGACAQPALSG